MNKTFIKAIFRDIKNSIGRFLSIMAIIIIGVAFMVGILASTPSVERSFNEYYKEHKTQDIDYTYGLGFSKEEVSTVLDKLGYQDQYSLAIISENSIISDKKISYNSRVYHLDQEYLETSTDLLQGRYPTNNKEAIVMQSTSKLLDIPIGTKLSTTVPTLIDGYLDNSIAFSEVEVVGITASPLYISRENEPSYYSAIPLDTVVFMPYEETRTTFTDILLTFDSLHDFDRFADDYFEEIDLLDGVIAPELNKITKVRTDELLATLQSYLDANPEQIYQALGMKEEELNRFIATLPSSFTKLTLRANNSYAYLKVNAEKVNTIIAIFPPFFIFVAALVALTAITRLVEEERSYIGTYKALGYSKHHICAKYLIYAGLSSVAGALIGLAAGISVLPVIIYNAYGSVFLNPPFHQGINIVGTTLTVLLSVVATLLVTFFAILNTLRDRPVTLMTPKAPKPGSRILLERIPLIWKHLRFKEKSTLRNLFRYKKHLIMTVFGIFGATSLLFGGFALRDSFDTLSSVTYNELRHYQISAQGSVNSDVFKDYFDSNTELSYQLYYSTNAQMSYKKGVINAEMVVIDDNDEGINDYVTIRNSGNKKEILLDENSFIISKQIAVELGLDIGDSLTFRVSNIEYSYPVSEVCENYLDNFIYMTKSSYQSLFKVSSTNNKALIKCPDDIIDQTVSELESLAIFTSIISEENQKEMYESLLETMQLIDWILIISAIALAIVIIYNITNVNISERKRELATLKVLGYSKVETAGYIMRVTFLLSLFGIAIGMIGGYLLSLFVVSSIETIGIMFGRSVYWTTYVFSILIMLFIICFVDLIMLPKIKSINPTESLKSIE